ncbi:leucine-rich repeat domain-containing protein [Hyunsoonleella pacifica]|uniref:Leucine-rich repeat domain-containing protein n=1 Tax=Hyunsoonleella pacifica TaxID=1080224 RepID=A0A4V2JB95_9FLAO|nr:hypothetical protein [Hyunsoonleella pacifica]TBN17888.1 hypothetical protein EYD46_06155 [Hyunsoonleella pacifica]GGD08054.1 hypothetical protein GCM10011368_07530 [Hyunsoonleella pacifica]
MSIRFISEEHHVFSYTVEAHELIVEYLNKYPDAHFHLDDESINAEKQLQYFSEISNLNISSLLIGFSVSNVPTDIESLYHHKSLKRLGLGDGLNKLTIDLSNFPELKYLSTNWFSKLKNIGALHKLEKLNLFKYKPKNKDLIELSELVELRELKLASGNYESLDGLDKLKQLKELRLYQNSKLKINENVVLNSVENLDITNCKLVNADFYKSFPNVKILCFDNTTEIISLKPILDGLKKLEQINVYGANILEEDNSYWLDYKNIKSFNFRDRRHHKLKTKDFLNYPYLD